VLGGPAVKVLFGPLPFAFGAGGITPGAAGNVPFPVGLGRAASAGLDCAAWPPLAGSLPTAAASPADIPCKYCG
jgi:hypothetical protein